MPKSGADWIVFAPTGEPRPDAVAGALACKALLRTVLSGYGHGGSAPIPAWVCGHAPDGALLSDPHLAAAPLPDAGWEASQGRLMGLALIPPRSVTEAVACARNPNAATVTRADVDILDQIMTLERALAGTVKGGVLSLRPPGGLVWPLAWDTEGSKQSLHSRHYTGPVILGAGRFVGLGLCRPLRDAQENEA